MKTLNVILAVSLLGISANALAKESLAHQMWRLAYPNDGFDLPNTIPPNAKKVYDQYLGDKNFKLIFVNSNKELDCYSSDISYQTTIDADYGNGYLLLHNYPCEGEGVTSEEIVAFKDNKGKYTIFDSDVSYLKGYGIAECTIYPYGRTFSSNRPLQQVLPKLSIETFVPDFDLQSLEDPLYYLDVNFPRKGTTVTATIRPLFSPLYHLKGEKINRNGSLIYGEFEIQSYNDIGTLINIIAEWAKQLQDTQSLNALLNRQPLNSDDKQALIKIIEKHRDDLELLQMAEPTDMQTVLQENLPEVMQLLNNIYRTESKRRYRSIELAWDRKQRRFHISKKIPASNQPASLYDYVISLAGFQSHFECFDENYHGYGYMQ